MTTTERQEEILNKIVEDYIDLAQPISSELLERKHHFGLSSATLRIEMQKLTDGGYLIQPHISSGRVPADKGYRFFVDKILENKKKNIDIENWFDEEFQDAVKFFQSLTRKMAQVSQSLAFGYLHEENIFWKEGWEAILKEPEFEEKDCLASFADFLKDLEKNIDNLEMNSGIKIYIGKENPFPKAKNFSIIFSKCSLPNKEEGMISLLGPKRMDYDKNISLIDSLTKLLKIRNC